MHASGQASYDRWRRIVLKNSEIEPPRKSRFREHCVISADSPHGRACRRRTRQNRSLRRTPKQFFIEAASGLLNRVRCGNSSFSTSGNGRELFREGRYDRPVIGRGDPTWTILLASISRWMRRMFAFSIAKAWWFTRVKRRRWQRRSPANWQKRQVVVASYSRPDAWRRSCFTG